MSALTSKSFWADAIERAVRTVAQSLLALLTVNGISLYTIDWEKMLSAAVLAGAISLLTSIAASGSGDKGTASFLK
nr:MAG TPA: holin [Caudoviricetes sp.]